MSRITVSAQRSKFCNRIETRSTNYLEARQMLYLKINGMRTYQVAEPHNALEIQ